MHNRIYQKSMEIIRGTRGRRKEEIVGKKGQDVIHRRHTLTGNI